jgi:hypothetical protein
MSGGRELAELGAELEEFARADDEAGAPTAASEHELARSLTEEARRAQAH